MKLAGMCFVRVFHLGRKVACLVGRNTLVLPVPSAVYRIMMFQHLLKSPQD
jgi:hypothetical protein